jgi:hypothetical protein
VENGFQFTTASGLPLAGGNGTEATCNITATTVAGPSRIDLWLRDAYINLGSGIPFPELEETLEFNTVQGQPVYAYPPGVRAVKALTLYRSDGTVITCETKDIKYIRRMNSINQGAPSIWCDFNNSIIFRPVPDANGPYLVTLDCWMKPVIEDPIETTPILLPDDWLEVLDYAACNRGHAELQEEDKAKSIQSLINGFTDPTGKYTPGLINELQTRMQATAPYVDWGVQPQGKTQTYGTR